MNTTPSWEPAINGQPNNLNATNHANQIDQFLGTHAFSAVYEGTATVIPAGGTNYLLYTGSQRFDDASQPFTMPGGSTTVGRVVLPVAPEGNGCDIFVSLCPDNAGVPNTSNVLASTSIPASWVNALVAPNGLASGGPLATAKSNTMLGSTNITAHSWAGPAGDATGVALNPTFVTSGNFVIMLGGSTSAPVAAVNSVEYLGDNTISGAVSQPALPQATTNGMAAVTTDTIVYMGGYSGGTTFNNVWSASWAPGTGVIGSWSAQAVLPTTLKNATSASFQNTVYVIGGDNGSGGILSSVYYANISNGQLTVWNTGPALPVAVRNAMATVVGNFLIVTGGTTTVGGASASSATYFSPINADGTLGAWRTGPSLPVGVYTNFPQWDTATTDSSIILIGGNTGSSYTDLVQILTVTAAGLSDQWYTNTWRKFASIPLAAFPMDNGRWGFMDIDIQNSQYFTSIMTPTGVVSVPLVASGLTPGNIYHVVIQLHSATSFGDFVSIGFSNGALPIDGLNRTPVSGSWVVQTGFSLPMTVYDNTPGGLLLHTWEDASSTGSTITSNTASRASTFVYNYNNLLIGQCDATGLPNDPLNSNPTFTSGTTPWTATGCTLTQSSAHVQGGFPFSGLMTPDGVTSGPFIESENVPINSGLGALNLLQWYLVQGWVFSPTGYNGVSLSINWFDSNAGYISTTFSGFNVAANTWTFLYTFGRAPKTAAFAGVNPTQSGTPTSSNLLYMSNVTITASPEAPGDFSSVSEIVYSATTPGVVTGVVSLN